MINSPIMSSASTSRLQRYQQAKSNSKKQSVKKMHQQKHSNQKELKSGLLYKPLVKRPSKKMLSKSIKKETARKKSLKKVLKNTYSEKLKRNAVATTSGMLTKAGAGMKIAPKNDPVNLNTVLSPPKLPSITPLAPISTVTNTNTSTEKLKDEL